MITRFEANGKQVVANQLGKFTHYADACSERAAELIAQALNGMMQEKRR